MPGMETQHNSHRLPPGMFPAIGKELLFILYAKDAWLIAGRFPWKMHLITERRELSGLLAVADYLPDNLQNVPHGFRAPAFFQEPQGKSLEVLLLWATSISEGGEYVRPQMLAVDGIGCRFHKR